MVRSSKPRMSGFNLATERAESETIKTVSFPWMAIVKVIERRTGKLGEKANEIKKKI